MTNNEHADQDLPRQLSLEGVSFLNQEKTVFSYMLEGWSRQQRSRRLGASTISQRASFLRRFQEFTQKYPWTWGPGNLEQFTSMLLSGPKPLSHSSVRSMHVAIRLFCDYASSPSYPWRTECEKRFNAAPTQICHEWNTASHLAAFEGKPTRRPFDYRELQSLFDAADSRVDAIVSAGKKGALSALRDSQLLKTTYAFGLRRREVLGLDVTDLRTNPDAPSWKNYGALHVRHGKSNNGSPPRRRMVMAVPEFEWALRGLADWTERGLPKFNMPESSALWPSERRGRLSARTLDDRFHNIRSDAGLPVELTLHSLRHSYVTHLTEHGYPAQFVQMQVGHAFASTTALYTSVSNGFTDRIVKRSLRDYFEPENNAPSDRDRLEPPTGDGFQGNVADE